MFPSALRIEAMPIAAWESRADQIVRLLARHGASGPDGRGWAAEAVCLLVTPDDDVAGVSAVRAEAVPLVGGRRLWVYRSAVADPAPAAADALLAASFDALERRFDPESDDPAGMGVLLGAAEAARRPLAVWERPPLLHAGFAADGRQLRVGWFEGARIDGPVSRA